eukprot:366538-Chlamydomonas_euryale.AAC.8
MRANTAENASSGVHFARPTPMPTSPAPSAGAAAGGGHKHPAARRNGTGHRAAAPVRPGDTRRSGTVRVPPVPATTVDPVPVGSICTAAAVD